MCLVWAWKIRLVAMARVETLSYHKMGGLWRKTSNTWIQHNSVAKEARALYSASVEDQEIVGCF